MPIFRRRSLPSLKDHRVDDDGTATIIPTKFGRRRSSSRLQTLKFSKRKNRNRRNDDIDDEKSGSTTNSVVTAIIDKARRTSPFLQNYCDDPTQVRAHFDLEEIELGKSCGNISGEFNIFNSVLRLPHYDPPKCQMTLPPNDGSSSDTFTNDGSSDTFASLLLKEQEEEQRRRICTSGEPYVIKRMNPKLLKKRKKKKLVGDVVGGLYEEALERLILEAQYLSRLQHPNIVQIRGLQKQVDDEYKSNNNNNNRTTVTVDDFFYITDRIVETLTERINKWKAQEEEEERAELELQQQSTSRGLELDTNSLLFPKKLRIAHAIASALQYLQEDRHRIALLNLTPDNIGFLEDGTVQLFDFSCCREIPKGTPLHVPQAIEYNNSNEGEINKLYDDDEEEDEEQPPALSANAVAIMLGSATIVVPPKINNTTTANTTSTKEEEGDGLTTTRKKKKKKQKAACIPIMGGVVPRYLAPEIVTDGQYSLKSDSYSFALIIYQMLTLSKPYGAYQPGQHMIKVCMEGKRPNLKIYRFPNPLENLLHRGWRHNTAKRITVRKMKNILSDTLQQQRNTTTTATTTNPTTTTGSSSLFSSQEAEDPPLQEAGSSMPAPLASNTNTIPRGGGRRRRRSLKRLSFNGRNQLERLASPSFRRQISL